MLVWVQYKMQEKKKKIDAAGTKCLFVLYPGFMAVNLIPSVSHQPLWQCGLVGGLGRNNEFDTAGIDRLKYDFPMSLHICKTCLISRKCVFSNSDLMFQCFVFHVEQCQQSELIPSGVNQATLGRDFHMLVVSASALLPAISVGAELDKIRGFENFVEVRCGEVNEG